MQQPVKPNACVCPHARLNQQKRLKRWKFYPLTPLKPQPWLKPQKLVRQPWLKLQQRLKLQRKLLLQLQLVLQNRHKVCRRIQLRPPQRVPLRTKLVKNANKPNLLRKLKPLDLKQQVRPPLHPPRVNLPYLKLRQPLPKPLLQPVHHKRNPQQRPLRQVGQKVKPQPVLLLRTQLKRLPKNPPQPQKKKLLPPMRRN